jgi:hypothetical protein
MSSGIDLLLLGTNNTPLAGFVIMSALGQKQTCAVQWAMSALPPKATSIASLMFNLEHAAMNSIADHAMAVVPLPSIKMLNSMRNTNQGSNNSQWYRTNAS